MTQNRPQPNEYAPFYQKYIECVPDGDLPSILEAQLADWQRFLSGMTDAEGELRYAPGKWSTKEVIGHITDTERIFAYRLLRIARGDRTSLPGFEQDDYVKEGNFSARSVASLLEEFVSVRTASLTLIRSLSPGALTRSGLANQKEISVRALLYIIAGHERHHRLIFEQHYLPMLRRSQSA